MQFILKPYLPAGQVHLLAGSSGTGKTTLLTQALASPSIHWGSVLYVATDRRSDSLRSLWELLGVDLPHVTLHSFIDEIKLKMDRVASGGGNTIAMASSDSASSMFSLNYVSALLSKGNYQTVILDPAPPLLPIKNFNDMGQVARAMAYLAAWAAHLNVTIILVFHTNKTKADSDFLNVLNLISGSHALLGYASTKALLVSKDESPDKQGPALIVQGQHFPDQVFQLCREDGSPAFNVAAAKPEVLEAPTDSPVLQYVFNTDTDFTPAIVSEATGLHRATVQRHLNKLLKQGIIAQVEYGVYTRALVN